MGDSLLLQKVSEIKILQDSTISQLEQIDKIVSGLKSESIFLKLLPLIGVIIGGLITWLIQKSLKDKELNLVISRELKDTSNKILTSLTSLQFHLKELAYLEVDSKYQYHLSLHSKGNEQKRALEEHYNDYKYISEVKNKISSCVADANSNFSAVYRLTNTTIPKQTSDSLLEFTNHILTLPREKEFEDEIEVTNELLQTKINSMATEYTKNISKIIILANNL